MSVKLHAEVFTYVVHCFLLQLIRSAVSFLMSLIVAAAQKLPSWAGSRAMWPLFAVRGFVGEADAL